MAGDERSGRRRGEDRERRASTRHRSRSRDHRSRSREARPSRYEPTRKDGRDERRSEYRRNEYRRDDRREDYRREERGGRYDITPSREHSSQQQSQMRALDIEVHPLLTQNMDISAISTGAVSMLPKASTSNTLANQRAALTLQARQPAYKKAKEVDPVAAFLAIKPPVSGPKSNPYFDPRLARAEAPKHAPRPLHFQPKGKFVAEAKQMRKEAKMEVLKRDIAESALSEGLDIDIVGDLLAMSAEQVPKAEWWDLPFYPPEADFNPEKARYDLINNLIQRPALLQPPADINALVVPKPLSLTTEERKKLRRQRRLQEQKEKQEKIRLGLLPPEEPRVKLASLSSLLAAESTQDPTKVEAEVKAKIAARQEVHVAANQARKEEANAKPKGAPELGPLVHVAVYKINRVDHNQWRYKIRVNAEQDYLTGCAILSPRTNIIVVEGSPKHLKHYKALLTRRINWNEPPPPLSSNPNAMATDEPLSPNNCTLLWEGTVEKASWNRFEVKEVRADIDVKEYLLSRGLENYWNLSRT